MLIILYTTILKLPLASEQRSPSLNERKSDRLILIDEVLVLLASVREIRK